MRYIIPLLLFILTSLTILAQTPTKKGQFYVYWGWNRGAYTPSDIHFKGDAYDFTLKSVIAKDRQSAFTFNKYFGLTKFTTPQYNVRIGYFLNDTYNISFGIDHMKYVVTTNQVTKISGSINATETIYDGFYNNNNIQLAEDFLTLEYTDGLNYQNIELRRLDNFINFDKLKISVVEGIGIGTLIPKSNVRLFTNERYDHFHLSGYGVNGVLGLNIEFFKYFFIQSEIKGGFMHMVRVRTTISKSDTAHQHFFFTQANVVFGGIFKIGK